MGLPLDSRGDGRTSFGQRAFCARRSGARDGAARKQAVAAFYAALTVFVQPRTGRVPANTRGLSEPAAARCALLTKEEGLEGGVKPFPHLRSAAISTCCSVAHRVLPGSLLPFTRCCASSACTTAIQVSLSGGTSTTRLAASVHCHFSKIWTCSGVCAESVVSFI